MEEFETQLNTISCGRPEWEQRSWLQHAKLDRGYVIGGDCLIRWFRDPQASLSRLCRRWYGESVQQVSLCLRPPTNGELDGDSALKSVWVWVFAAPSCSSGLDFRKVSPESVGCAESTLQFARGAKEKAK